MKYKTLKLVLLMMADYSICTCKLFSFFIFLQDEFLYYLIFRFQKILIIDYAYQVGSVVYARLIIRKVHNLNHNHKSCFKLSCFEILLQVNHGIFFPINQSCYENNTLAR